jgi:hypothetical protein
MRPVLVASLSLVAFCAASPAAATISIYNSAGAVQPDENVLFTDSAGHVVLGETNQTHSSVSFASAANVDLNAYASGQARVAAAGGPLDTLKFFLTDGGSFNSVEFDLHKADNSTGRVTVTFLGSFGATSRTFDLGGGNNWFSAKTDGGDTISTVTFDTDGLGVDDIRQIRLGGITSAEPEVASWVMMVGGFGAIGAVLRNRRRQAPLDIARSLALSDIGAKRPA